jgi:hypothetical protein
MSPSTSLELYLHEHDDRSWRRTADLLDAETHFVDRAAARISLSFVPIALSGLLREPHDQVALDGISCCAVAIGTRTRSVRRTRFSMAIGTGPT